MLGLVPNLDKPEADREAPWISVTVGLRLESGRETRGYYSWSMAAWIEDKTWATLGDDAVMAWWDLADPPG